jgi:hypothetical protein
VSREPDLGEAGLKSPLGEYDTFFLISSILAVGARNLISGQKFRPKIHEMSNPCETVTYVSDSP